MTRYSLLLTRERLMEVLTFDAEIGKFIWLKNIGNRRSGTVAGCLNDSGHRTIGIDGQVYYAHTLMWLLSYGEWPAIGIDHKDRNPDNNRPSNLRLASDAQNSWNRTAKRNNTSGHKGIFALRGKWMVSIQKNRKRHYIGYFPDLDAACEAQRQAYIELHGEFSSSCTLPA